MDLRSQQHAVRSSIDWHSTRRSWLLNSACGFGNLAAMALTSSCAQSTFADVQDKDSAADSNSTGEAPHHAPRAKRIIFLFMQGGVSQVDSFDYKPILSQRNGQLFVFNDARQIAKTGQATQQRLMRSPWDFRRVGDSGRWVSDLFPWITGHLDDLTMLHGMHTEGVAHGPATLFLHCGATNFIRPSFGSWVLYGLGNLNRELPGFVSIAPSVGNGGPRNYGNAFLPAQFQGTPVGKAGTHDLEIKDLISAETSHSTPAKRRALLERLNQLQIDRRLGSNISVNRNSELDAVLDSYELGWRMQANGPAWFDLSNETQATRRLYGLDNSITESYGRKCLMARRLCEAGVRFIQVNYGDNSANPAWDQHSNLPKHADHALAVDRPIAGLLTDLKQRGLLEDTIVWWGSEFGRTPYAQDNGTGRDHNPVGFTVWLLGGGMRQGYTHGETDEFGFEAVQGKVHMHDLHATLLHQLGIDHRRLTFSHAGRDFRLTDVHGRVVREIIEKSSV